jgi:hypothetical protein
MIPNATIKGEQDNDAFPKASLTVNYEKLKPARPAESL